MYDAVRTCARSQSFIEWMLGDEKLPRNEKTVPRSPTKKDSPIVGHPPPFMNILNTSEVVPWGARCTNGIKITKKPRV